MSASETSTESRRVFVGNLDYKADKNVLRELFQPFGKVLDVYTPFDTSKSDKSNKGFAFVEMSSHAEAKQAMTSLDGVEGPGGRRLAVKMAQPRSNNKNVLSREMPRLRE